MFGQDAVSAFLPFMANDMIFALSVGSLLALPLLYAIFLADWRTGLPPRMSVLVPALTGKFQLKEHGPIGAVQQGYERFGDIFRMKIMNKGFTFLIGGKASALFYDGADKDLSQREVYRFTVPAFGPGIVYDAPPAVMIQQLKFLRTGLTGASMAAYAPKIIKETQDFFGRWGDEGEISLREALAELVILTASRCLLGDEVRDQLYDEMADLYQDLNDGMTIISVFAPNLPTKAHRARDVARAKIGKLFSRVIAERKKRQAANPDEVRPVDFLQTLIDSTYRDGRRLTDEEITGLLVSALFAGSHTSSGTSAWMGLMLLRNPELIPRLMEEQKEVTKETGGEITFESILKMDLMHSTFKETLRMFPPLILLMRLVKNDQTYKGYTIPKGDIAVVCPPVSHRLPEVYTNPDTFDPDRFFDKERGEGAGKHEFMAFGGGRHSCLGERFAALQIMTVFSTLLRDFEFELLDKEEPRIDYTSIVAGPGNEINVRFRRKKRS